jgi:hypothetical protein
MSAKHTPGPWGVEKYEPSCLTMGGQALGHVAPDTASSEEREVNARLIAAAPELLEALKSLLAHHRVQSLPSTDTLTPRIEAARAAIARAEGK